MRCRLDTTQCNRDTAAGTPPKFGLVRSRSGSPAPVAVVVVALDVFDDHVGLEEGGPTGAVRILIAAAC